jgi:Fic family protein
MPPAFAPERPYLPLPLPPAGIDWAAVPGLNAQLLRAHRYLGELNAHTLYLKNPSLLLSTAVIRESISSSRIENIRTTVAEVLQKRLLPDNERSEVDKEVLRYNAAIWGAFERMRPPENLPLSLRVVQQVHTALMNREEGFRRLQNKIENTQTGEVIYTPPPASAVPQLLADLEAFIHQETPALDPLIKIALTHYQFEAIHPYSDGNGRTGRILMVLQLVAYGLLRMPVLFISAYINQNRKAYYQLLAAVTERGNWQAFVVYMVEGFATQAQQTCAILRKMNQLQEELGDQVREVIPQKAIALGLTTALMAYPIITPSELAGQINVTRQTASNYLKLLETAKVLEFVKAGRYAFYSFKPLVTLLESPELFDDDLLAARETRETRL